MPDGKEVLYAYDAAGRLVQEGEKSYEYGWLDKVTRILENGKEVARFEYHNNNQLAKVVRENGIETFEWDGLALIERNGIKYINEPHAGGGNPILAIGGDGQKNEAIFTDILGTSMGKVSGNGYSAIDKTSFGADTSDKSSFFTGKPYVEGLGYAFLFRNYRADIGKWLTQDLIGYPDGWNNFAYCGNNIIDSIDFLGCAKKYIKTRDLDTDIIGLRNMQHSWTEIWVTREEYNNMSSEYKSGEFEGKWKNYGSTDDYYSITLSANRDPETGNLIKQTGDPKDSGAKNIYDYGHDFDLSSIEGVLENHKNYNNQADYDEIPYYGDKNNCNSYTNTINNGDLPDGIKNNPYCPGINSTIDGKYYE